MATATPTIADIILPHPQKKSLVIAREALLIVGGTALMAGVAQLAIPLKPVPITFQTLGVLLIGAAYGWKRGGATMFTYVAAGTAGLPIFAEGKSGPAVLFGFTGGYLAGFIFAAALVGFLAERGWDRTPWMTALAMLLGNVVIYLFGLPWLAVVAHQPASYAVQFGLLPFLLGDGIKLIAAVVLLPAAHFALGPVFRQSRAPDGEPIR